jgi:aminoglycoside phosphotransferase (APT) family kinase protein
MSVQRGRASTVTDLGDGTVLRTGGDPEREAALMALAAAAGIPVPRVLEVRADGLILQRIDGPTMARRLMRRPWQAAAQAAILASLHEELHRVPLDGESLLHLDLHPENVLLGAEGPVLIDWTNAGSGRPEKDVALTWLILETSGGLPGRILARLFARRVGSARVRRGLSAAREFRLADPNVTRAERARVLRAGVRTNDVASTPVDGR